MKTQYCISFIDSSSNDINNAERMVIGIYGDNIETTPDFNYFMTREQAESTLADYQRIAEEKGWDWANFYIEDNAWMQEEEK